MDGDNVNMSTNGEKLKTTSVVWCGIPTRYSEVGYCFWVKNRYGNWHMWERTYDTLEAERIFSEYIMAALSEELWFMESYRGRA
jgi:hypothetical protein